MNVPIMPCDIPVPPPQPEGPPQLPPNVQVTKGKMGAVEGLFLTFGILLVSVLLLPLGAYLYSLEADHLRQRAETERAVAATFPGATGVVYVGTGNGGDVFNFYLPVEGQPWRLQKHAYWSGKKEVKRYDEFKVGE